MKHPITIALPVKDFTNLTAAVLPHASTDLALPLLVAVQFTTHDGHLYAAATDRFTMALGRTKATGSGQFVLSVAEVKRIVAWFKAPRGTSPDLELTVNADETVTARLTGLMDVVDANLTVRQVDGAAKYPPIKGLIAKRLDVTAKAEPVCVMPALLARFTAATKLTGPAPVQVLNGGTAEPWLVKVGEDFLGLVMPVHREGADAPDLADKAWRTFLGEGSKSKAAAEVAA